MNRRDAEQILREALQLSESERARVAAEFLTSLGWVKSRAGDGWIAEVERRAQAAIDGVPALTWHERERVFRNAFPKLANSLAQLSAASFLASSCLNLPCVPSHCESA